MLETEGIIRKVGNKWVLFSHKGKELFKHTSKKRVMDREREINFFKHKGKGMIAISVRRNSKKGTIRMPMNMHMMPDGTMMKDSDMKKRSSPLKHKQKRNSNGGTNKNY